MFCSRAHSPLCARWPVVTSLNLVTPYIHGDWYFISELPHWITYITDTDYGREKWEGEVVGRDGRGKGNKGKGGLGGGGRNLCSNLRICPMYSGDGRSDRSQQGQVIDVLTIPVLQQKCQKELCYTPRQSFCIPPIPQLVPCMYSTVNYVPYFLLSEQCWVGCPGCPLRFLFELAQDKLGGQALCVG